MADRMSRVRDDVTWR